ncbi:MAG: ABC transporter ATP-binding protein [Candidatus Leucobacter sulfamidivorax]|nr:ABC transporter ATP-binding protein [Candidatus Leucobacter sulfamidivorax]
MRELWGLYKEVLGAISPSARSFLIWYAVLLGLLSIIDALALGFLAILIAPVAVGETVSLPLLGELNTAQVFIAIGALCLIIILKGFASLGVLFWGYRRCENYEIELGSRLFSAYIRSPWEMRIARNSSDIVRFTDGSVATMVNSFLVPGATLLSEGLSFLSILVVLAVAQPATAAMTLVYLGLIGILLYLLVARRARLAGEVNLRFAVLTSRLILGMVQSMKEIALRGKLDEVGGIVEASRRRATRARANIMFLGQVPRYALESGIIGGFVLIGLVGFWVGGAAGALTSVALFSVAGFRMAPAVVRTQSVLSEMTANAPHARVVLDEIAASEKASEEFDSANQQPLQANPQRLTFEDVTFTYKGAPEPALKRLSLSIEMGTTVAFVGPSGSGKSTLIDMVLGFLQPRSGSVRLDDVPLVDVTESWRPRLGYVPQDVSIFDGTVAENVALSWSGEYDEQAVKKALGQARLLETIEARPGGLNAKVGERGLALSGGQRQRLGIARALYPEPLVLVMDEATSALDTKTEAEVNDAIAGLRGKTTLILVAHRLSTIMQADTIFYMRDGKVVDQGTFDELIERVPDFAHQAQLSGLA